MVLWQHIVLCKSTLLGMRLAYGVRPVLLRTTLLRNNVLLHNTTCCHNTLLM